MDAQVGLESAESCDRLSTLCYTLSHCSGDLRAYSPASFIDSCARLGLPNNVRQQNDASEFCGMLMGAIESQFKGRPELRAMQASVRTGICLYAFCVARQ